MGPPGQIETQFRRHSAKLNESHPAGALSLRSKLNTYKHSWILKLTCRAVYSESLDNVLSARGGGGDGGEELLPIKRKLSHYPVNLSLLTFVFRLCTKSHPGDCHSGSDRALAASTRRQEQGDELKLPIWCELIVWLTWLNNKALALANWLNAAKRKGMQETAHWALNSLRTLVAPT